MARRDATNAVGKLMETDIKKECIHLSTKPCFKPKLSKVSEKVIARDIIAAIAAVYIVLWCFLLIRFRLKLLYLVY